MKIRLVLNIFWIGLLALGMLDTGSLLALEWEAKAPKELDENSIVKKIAPKENVAQIEAIVRNRVEYKAQGLKSPFQSPFKVKEAKIEPKKEVDKGAGSKMPVAQNLLTPPVVVELPKFIVQGLIWGGAFPQAIINNTVVRKGDVISDAKVVKINSEGVTVLFNKKEYNLSSPSVMGQQQTEEKPGENPASPMDSKKTQGVTKEIPRMPFPAATNTPLPMEGKKRR